MKNRIVRNACLPHTYQT